MRLIIICFVSLELCVLYRRPVVLSITGLRSGVNHLRLRADKRHDLGKLFRRLWRKEESIDKTSNRWMGLVIGTAAME
jgi:hypothetical protein